MAYPDVIKDEIISRWKWASAARKAALKQMVDDAADADPAVFLSDLIALHKADTTHYSPEFAATLKRWQTKYTADLARLQPADADALLESIIREWGVPPSGGDLV